MTTRADLNTLILDLDRLYAATVTDAQRPDLTPGEVMTRLADLTLAQVKVLAGMVELTTSAFGKL